MAQENQGQLGTVSVSVSADLTSYQKGMQQAKQEADKFDKAANKSARGVKKTEAAAKSATREMNSFAKSFRSASDSAAFVTGPLGGVASRITLLGNAIRLGYTGTLVFSAALTGLGFALAQSVKQAEAMERSMFNVSAVLKATGNASGLTAEQIRTLSREIGLATLASTQGVEAAAAKLLTFRSIQGDIFVETLKLSQDLAEIGFGSIESAAVQLGKALQDPEQGLQALTRVGITFSYAQKQTIKSLVDSNKLWEAQRIILNEVQKQVGGAGAAAAGGLTGAYDTFNQRYDEFLENIGNTGPLTTWTNIVNTAAKAIDNWNKALFKTGADQINELLAERVKLEDGIAKLRESERADTPLGQIIIKRDMERIGVLNQLISKIQEARNEELKRQSAAIQASEDEKKRQEEERRLAKEQEAADERRKDAAREAEKLANRRKETLSELKSELEILTQVKNAYVDQGIAAEEMEAKKRALTIISQLQFEANSAEAEQITDLVSKHSELQKAIDAETDARRELEQAQTSFKNDIDQFREKTDALEAEARSFGMAADQAEAYRVEQELINKAIRAYGSLSQSQATEIEKVAAAYGSAAARVEELKEQQREAEKQAERMADAQQRFQETLADGLTDAIFGADSAADAIRNLALELSKAAVQAQLLALIQKGMGQQNPDQGLFYNLGKSLAGSSGAAAGGGGGSSGFISSVMASQMHTGGVGGQDGLRRNVSSSTFIGAPRFHDGLRPNEFPAILERGEGVIPKEEMKDSGGSWGRKSVVIYQNIQTKDVDSFRMSRRQVARQTKKAIE